MEIRSTIARVTKEKYFKIFLVCSLFLYIIYKNSSYGIINYDDYRFMREANSMISEKGIFYTLYYSFFNMDLGNEYRTYGLLRVFTILWTVIFGTNPAAYGFLLGAVHCLSAALVYVTAKKLFDGKLGEKSSLLIAGIWLMNPFSTTQSMHHMLYILMPVYLFILLLWIDLTCKKYKYILEFFCMLGIVFFGENMIITLYLFLAYRILQNIRNKTPGWGYLWNGILVILVLGGHYLHYKLFRYSSDIPERFSLSGLGNIKISTLTANFLDAISGNLRNVIVVWNKFNLGYVREHMNVLLVICYIVLCAGLYFLLCRGCSNGQKIRKVKIFASAGLCISTYFIYLALQIMGNGGFNSRYMMGCVPCAFIAVVLLLSQMDGRLWRALSVGIFCILGVSWMIHYSVMLDYMGEINDSVIASIEEGEDKDKKFVVFVNAYPNNEFDAEEYNRLRQPGVFTDSEQFYRMINGSTIASPFQMLWSIQGWMREYSSMIPVYGYEKNADGTYNLTGELNYNDIAAEDIMIISTEDIYFYNNDRRVRPVAYYDMEEFEQHSLAYAGVKILGDQSYYTSTKRQESIDVYYELIYNNNVVSINCGADTSDGILEPDREFQKVSDESTGYGYIGGGVSQYEGSGLKGFDTNRNGEFSYRFELDTRRNVILCLEFQDIWSKKTGARVFDLNVTTDKQNIVIDDIDLYSIGQNDIVRILIPLMETSLIEVQAITEKGDIPFCNVIRVLDQQN